KAAEEGKAYLAENAKKEGVQTTDSGLQYEVLKEGDGVSPSETDMVEVHYEGTLVNGEVFDSSYERGEPTSFPLNRVIPGWTEGLQLMKEGAKYRFVIPSELAYGDRELGDGQIPPNSTLIFTVELLNVQKDEPDTE
ncbi:MAG TPA: peptidylprolyl isomerase, partial [Idiomarina loihiensis]|nr:peptidylprolyl isomerase [Idiomarina loihiensis]